MVEDVLSLAGNPLPRFAAAVSRPHGHSPLRRPNSVRRTSSIDVIWPDGAGGLMELRGTARDLVTDQAGEGRVIAQDGLHVLAERRTIRSISSDPPRRELQRLQGATAGNNLRTAVAEALPQELAAGTPLYLLLDDLAGATLVAGWAHSQGRGDASSSTGTTKRRMAGICIGFRPGSGALSPDGTARTDQHSTAVMPLTHPDDPLGWHDLPDLGGINFRRARRIDVWHDGDDTLQIDATFQDSANSPGGQRVAIHEYRLFASVDGAGRLRSVEAIPGTLPFAECRAAPTNIDALLSVPVAKMRHQVLSLLHTTYGCTHLNDMLRALAEVPVLALHLPARDAAPDSKSLSR